MDGSQLQKESVYLNRREKELNEWWCKWNDAEYETASHISAAICFFFKEIFLVFLLFAIFKTEKTSWLFY